MKIIQEETYKFVSKLPERLPKNQLQYPHPLVVMPLLQKNRVTVTFKPQEGGITVPIYLKDLYSEEGVRKPVGVTSLYIWGRVNGYLEHLQQTQAVNKEFNIQEFQLVFDYLAPAENITVDGVQDRPAHVYILKNQAGDTLMAKKEADSWVLWLNKQPIKIRDYQHQYQIESYISRQMMTPDELSDLLKQEAEIFPELDDEDL